MKKRTGVRGEAHALSKLKTAQVMENFRRAWEGEKQIALAAEYGVDQQMISSIKLSKRWKHLELHHDGASKCRRAKRRTKSIEEPRQEL